MRNGESYVPLCSSLFSRTQIHASQRDINSNPLTLGTCNHRACVYTEYTYTYTHVGENFSKKSRNVFPKRGEGRSGQRFKLAAWLVEIPICSQFFKRGGSGNEVEEKGIQVETESPWGLRRHYTPRLSADAPKTILNSRKSCEGPLSFANSLPSSRSFRLPLANGAHIIPLPLPPSPWSFDPPPRFAPRNSRERKTKTIVWSFPPSGRATFLRPLVRE